MRAPTTLDRPILAPGRNVWRIVPARRAALLIDGAAFFAALRQALRQARRSILVVGWDIHSRTELPRGEHEPQDDLPTTLVDVLAALVKRRPELRIRLLLWHYSMLFAGEREWFPSLALGRRTPPQISLRLDNRLPFGSSQHQKIVLIDDRLAFTGGLDVTVRRWDTSAHRLDEPGRVDPDGKPYAPFHDVQAMVEGEAARALGEIARARWQGATGEVLPPAPGDHDVWPACVTPDFADLEMGIARTQPLFNGQEEVREVEALFRDAIDGATRAIYIENQFVTWTEFARRLAARMTHEPRLEALIVTPRTYTSWIEAHTMRSGRGRFLRVLRESGVADRARLVYPRVSEGDRVGDTMVHSKLMIVDDRLLRVGSANLNHRSLGADAECDVVVEARHARERAAIARIRARLLAEHCGVAVEEVAAALARTESLLDAVGRLTGGGHSLQPVDDGDEGGDLAATIVPLADPPRPITPEAVATAVIGKDGARQLPTLAKGLSLVLALALLIGAWRYTPLSRIADPDLVRSALEGIALGYQWAIVLGVFVIAGVLGFPITVLIAATALIFGPWLGFAYAAAGSLLSAISGYAIGVKLGRKMLLGLLGRRLNDIRRKIVRRGVFAVAAIRLVPLAPFTVVNLVAGASGLRLRPFVGGTALGMAPGILAMSAFSDQAARVVSDPTPGRVATVVVLVLCWLAVCLAVEMLISRLGGERA